MEVYSDASFADTENGGSTDFTIIFMSGVNGEYKMAVDWTRNVQACISVSSMGYPEAKPRHTAVLWLPESIIMM